MKKLCSKSVFLGGVALSTVCAPMAFAQSSDSESFGIADIVVTAQKREQSLQDVPVSISAMGEEAIVANKIHDVSDLSRVTPNLTVREGAGGSKIPQYILRGIYTAGSAPGADKGVSLYLDGVYIQNVAGSVFEFADIERVEVLRGPQGTLFGRNSTGGAISIISRNPSGELSVRQDISVGNFNQFRSKTRIDLPKIGPVSLSASYLHSERRGDVRNLGAGTVWDHTQSTNGRFGQVKAADYLGDENVEALFVSAKIDVHPDIDLSYKYDYSENHYTPTATGVSYLPGSSALQYGGFAPPQGTQVGGASLAAANAAYDRYMAQNPALRTPITKRRPGAVNNAYTQPSFNKSQGHNFTARWQASDSLSFKNILSMRKASNYSLGFQLDGLGGLMGGYAAGLPASNTLNQSAPFLPVGVPLSALNVPMPGNTIGVPVVMVANNAGNDQKQWSNEFQMNYSSDLLTFTAGYIHFQDKQVTGGLAGQFNTVQYAPIVGQGTSASGTAYVIPGNTGYFPSRTKTTSDAVFAQPELHVTDKLDIVAGLRYTWDKKDGSQAVPGQTSVPFTPANGVTTPIRYRDSRLTYLIGANYQATPDLLVYAKYVTGYISGGQLATISYNPETAKSAELGVKADLFDRRVRSNLALFHVNYDSIQQVTLGSNTGVPGALNYGQAIVSLADAKAKGFEWENTFLPARGVTLQANVGYTDFKFDSSTAFAPFVFQSGAGGIVEDAFRPKWTLNVSGQYETPEVIGGARLLFRADASWKSKAVSGTDITPGNGPSAQVDPAYLDALTIPASWNVNGRIALNGFDMGGDAKGTVALWGKNILNSRVPVQITSLGFAASPIYERARTYGIDVTVQFR